MSAPLRMAMSVGRMTLALPLRTAAGMSVPVTVSVGGVEVSTVKRPEGAPAVTKSIWIESFTA